jgi:hypothetical protein
MNAPAPTSPMSAAPAGGLPGSYPAGADVVQGMKGQDGMVDNPVIAGFRAIMMFAKTLMDRGDPRGPQAAQHIAGLLQTLQGAPMDSPMPAAPAGAPQGAPAGMPPSGEPPMMPGGPAPELPQDMGAGAASMPPTPSAPTPPPAPPAPDGMAFDPFSAPPEAPPSSGPQRVGGSKPMFTQPTQGKRPVVLT